MATVTTQPKAVPPTKFENQLTTMDNGILKYLPAAASLTLEGTSTKQPAIDTALKGWLQTFNAVEVTKQAYQDAVKARLAITVEARTYYKALVAALKQYFGTQSAMLNNFGITPDKVKTTSTTTKLQAAAKAKQTKAVRGTLSKKQKAAITVVGNPPITLSSDGTLQAGPPPINLPASSSSTPSTTPAAPTPGSVSAPVVNAAPAPAAPGSGGTNSGSGTPAA